MTIIIIILTIALICFIIYGIKAHIRIKNLERELYYHKRDLMIMLDHDDF